MMRRALMPRWLACLALCGSAASESHSGSSDYSNSDSLNPSSSDSSTSNVILCGQYDTHNISSGLYTFSTNEWGDDGSGSQCITVADNGTIFNATWIWSENATLVHSFPNINLNSALLPLQLSNMSSLNIKSSWSMTPSSNSDTTSLVDISASANVVVDMFADPDAAVANSTTLPKYEIMVWIAAFNGRKPIGYSSSIKKPPTCTLSDNTTFTLYKGPNNNGQFVYTWLANSSIEDFDEDISRLIEYLWKHKYISESNYLGIVQFGTETFHADSNVTFSARNFNMTIASGKQSAAAASSSSNFVASFAWIGIATIFSFLVSI